MSNLVSAQVTAPTGVVAQTLQSEGGSTPDLASTSAAVAQPSVSSASALYTESDLRARLDKARNEEKTKLHKEMEELRTEAATLRVQVKERMDPSELQAAQLQEAQDDLRATQTKLAVANAELLTIRGEYEGRLASLSLEVYRQRRLRQEMTNGGRLIETMVRGSTEAEIEDSIALARAEYETIYARAQTEVGVARPAPRPVGTTTVSAPAPAAFPAVPVTAPQAVNAVGDDMQERIREWTSPEAVRNGTYAKHRDEIHRFLQENGSAPPAGASFAQAPRQLAMPATVHGSIEQPHGLPTPAVQNPSVQFAPPAPLQAPDTTTPFIQQQPVLIPPVHQPASGPQAPSIAEMRAQAVSSAQRALGGPLSIATAATGKPASKAGGGEYAVDAPLNLPAGALTGQNPMIRNSA